jgi:hypothetical protein
MSVEPQELQRGVGATEGVGVGVGVGGWRCVECVCGGKTDREGPGQEGDGWWVGIGGGVELGGRSGLEAEGRSVGLGRGMLLLL